MGSVSHSLYTGRPHTRAATRPLAPPSSLKMVLVVLGLLVLQLVLGLLLLLWLQVVLVV